MPFAKRLALRYRGASESFDDLLQVANLGLVNAVDRFDPERGIPFTAFASPTILGELKRHFRDRVWTVRVPRGLHDRMAEVDKAITELTKKLQRSPSVGEIAERLELEQTDVLEVMEANHNRRPLSLDRPGRRRRLRRSRRPPSGSARRTRASSWSRAGSPSTPRCPTSTSASALVLRLRFVEDMTQSQIAEQIGHSQMHVSRILRRALARIREQIEEGAGRADRLGAGSAKRTTGSRRRSDSSTVSSSASASSEPPTSGTSSSSRISAAPPVLHRAEAQLEPLARSRRARAARCRRRSGRAPPRRSRR